jgi:hypothetical protein
MAEVTVSPKNRIRIPRAAVIVEREETAIVPPRPQSWTDALRGLAPDSYPAGYLNDERDSWE